MSLAATTSSSSGGPDAKKFRFNLPPTQVRDARRHARSRALLASCRLIVAICCRLLVGGCALAATRLPPSAVDRALLAARRRLLVVGCSSSAARLPPIVVGYALAAAAAAAAAAADGCV